MRLSVLAAALAFACVGPAAAQTATVPPPVPPPAVAAAPGDVATPEAIVAALYDVISGDAGVARDWDRFRALFHPTGRLIPSGINREGQGVARSITPQEYIDLSGPVLVEQGFHEREIARRTERFADIVHVWSTYEAVRGLADPVPFLRGVNSIQLFNDGARWWVISVYWQAETPDAPIPPAYLPPAA